MQHLVKAASQRPKRVLYLIGIWVSCTDLHDSLLLFLYRIHDRPDNRVQLQGKFIEEDQGIGNTCLNPMQNTHSESYKLIVRSFNVTITTIKIMIVLTMTLAHNLQKLHFMPNKKSYNVSPTYYSHVSLMWLLPNNIIMQGWKLTLAHLHRGVLKLLGQA